MDDGPEKDNAWKRIKSKVPVRLTQPVYDLLRPHFIEKLSINYAVAAATMDLGAGDMEDTPDGDGGAVGGVGVVGVLPNGQHTIRHPKREGKAGRTGMALVEAPTKITNQTTGQLAVYGLAASGITSAVQAMVACLERVAAAYEENTKPSAVLLHAAELQLCEVKTVKTKVEVVKLMKEMGAITEEEAKKLSAEVGLALFKPASGGETSSLFRKRTCRPFRK